MLGISRRLLSLKEVMSIGRVLLEEPRRLKHLKRERTISRFRRR